MSPETKDLYTRFDGKVDAELRKKISRRGDLMKMILLILKTIDLTTVPLIEISSDLKSVVHTTVSLPASLHKKIKRIAFKRESSMNALVNSAVWAYTKTDTTDPSTPDQKS